jgi:cytochrome P450
VHWNERYQLWVVTRYDDVVWMIRHHELFSSAVIRNDPRPPYPPVDSADLGLVGYVRRFRADQLVEHDRPEHLAMRQVVHGYFTPRTMESWRPFVRQAVAELLDEAEARGRMDVLTDLAAPLPVRVITQMMGVPPEDREHLRELADKLLYINRGEPDRLRPLTEGMRGMLEYVEPLVEARLERPGADFISVLAQGEKSGVFTRHQVLVNTALLLFAGHETTMNLICNGTLALIRHPDQWRRLKTDPAGWAQRATEECLRYDPPVKSTQRIAAEDVELGGKTLRRNDRIRWAIASANRDPAAFPDPDRFDIGRHPNAHVAFGAGIHFCLGVTLARVEGQEVFRALAERFPALHLASDRLEYQPSIQFRSLKALPVSWS